MAKTRSFARTREKSRRVCDLRADFQGPDWVLGQTTMAALGDGRIGCTWKEGGIDRIGVLEIVSGSLVELEQSCVAVSSLCTHAGGMAWLGQTAYSPVEVWWAEPESLGGDEEGQVRLSGRAAKVFEVGDVGLDPAEISVARGISFVAPSGRNVHALLYEPFGESDASKGSPPPLVVMCHGGPTSSAGAGLDLFVQLLTTRGFAVAAINYAGSSGYGRAVRRSLDGLWGVADVDDCVDAVRYLASQGLVDVTKIAIRGSSAGGLTALNALVRSDLFAVAVSWYGVTDLVGLASMTHDFESRYTDRLVGPLPDALDSYHERSPLYRVDDMSGSVLLLQGSDDPVVPASQAESMAKALRERGLRCELLVFEGESHGFRRVETLIACMEAEIAFYQEVFGW